MKDRVPFKYWDQPAEALAIEHPSEASNSASGYIRISRNNKVQYLHRWLWEELKGPIPEGHTIDHRNGVKTDCRIDNLRCVPEVFNLRNSALSKHNTSGVRGVSYWKAHHAWRAVSYDHITGKQKCATFSINVHGNQAAFDLACDTRAEMIAKLNEQGAGYTDRHGS